MININLIAERERLRRVGENAGRIAFFVAVAMFALAIVAFSLQQGRLYKKGVQVQQAQADIANLTARKAEIDSIQGQLDSKCPLIELLRAAQDSERKWCVAMGDIQLAQPVDVTLSSARSSSTLRREIRDESDPNARIDDREGFILIGYAGSNESVSNFISAVQDTQSFGEVDWKFTRRRPGLPGMSEIYEFELHAYLDDGGEVGPS